MKTEFPCFYEVNLHSFQKDLKSFFRYYNEKRTQHKLGFVSPKDYYLNYQKIA
ncbi:hypothetical protein [Neobacillus ginsengisoli]|uniref:hypothetical protein n=1 Tax=Neobacillus ginsengisoli TaxID=904295 RepID=UPI0035221CB2